MAKICDFVINIDGKPTELTREELINYLSKVDKKTGESPFDTFVKEGAKVIDLSSIEQARLSGPSAKALNRTAERLGLPKILPGNTLSSEEYRERGRLFIENGVDPEQVANEFKQNPDTISADMISIAAAHESDLMKIGDDARKKYGLNSEEFKNAQSEWKDWAINVLQPMGTAWSAAGQALQGLNDVDTGSFISMAAAYQKQTKEAPTGKAAAEIEKLTKEKEQADIKVKELEAKLTEIIDKATKDEEAAAKTEEGIKEKAKKIATFLRNAKIQKGNLNSSIIPPPIWNAALEVSAKTVEISGDIAQAIKDGIETTWASTLQWVSLRTRFVWKRF